MPSPFSGIIQDMRARDSRASTQQDVMMRMMEMRQRAMEAERFRQYMANYQNQNSPAAARERRLAAHQKLTENQKLSWSKYALTMDESEVPQEQRAKFRNLQKLISTDPVLYADVAQRLVQQMKPHAIQKMTNSTIDDEGNTISEYEIYDPNNPALTPMTGVGAAPMGGGSGSRPSVAAPTSRGTRGLARPKTRIESLTDRFMGAPAAEAPPPAPFGSGPPAVPGWED